MKNYAIALGFKGKLYNNIIRAWKIFEKSVGIKYISTFHTQPHIVIIAGKTKNIEKIYKNLKKIKINKFKLKSPGLGVFANKEPNLYIRWEQSSKLIKICNLINKKSINYFHNIYQNPKNSFWVPKTTLAYKDLNYADLKSIFSKAKFIFKKNHAIIDSIYLINFDSREILTHKIKLK